jgi:hypothetical protein
MWLPAGRRVAGRLDFDQNCPELAIFSLMLLAEHLAQTGRHRRAILVYR